MRSKGRRKMERSGIFPQAKGYIVYDLELCTGCCSCEIACSAFKNNGKVKPELSRIQIKMKIFSGKIDNFEPKPCLQCDEPKCLLACPVENAFFINTESGARVINESLCIGCKQCIEACAREFDPPRIRFDQENNVAVKCDLCSGDPQCVRWCPNGALKYITLSEFRKLRCTYQMDFQEPYIKDFGPDVEILKASEMTLKKLFPKKEDD